MKQWFITELVVVLLFCSLFVGVYKLHNTIVESSVQAVVTSVQHQAEHQNILLQQQTEEQTQALQQLFNTVTEEKDAEIKTLNTRIAVLSNSLQSRPSRDSEGSNLSETTRDAESTGYASADRLYREDAEFLVWYSSQTEQLRLELLACYMQYDKAKALLDDVDTSRSD